MQFIMLQSSIETLIAITTVEPFIQKPKYEGPQISDMSNHERKYNLLALERIKLLRCDTSGFLRLRGLR